MLHDSSTLHVSSIRMVIYVTAAMVFRLFLHYVTEEYLPRKSNLTRKVNIIPKKIDMGVLGLKEVEILELFRPLYGLCDAGYYCGETMMKHMINDLPCAERTEIPHNIIFTVVRRWLEFR